MRSHLERLVIIINVNILRQKITILADTIQKQLHFFNLLESELNSEGCIESMTTTITDFVEMNEVFVDDFIREDVKQTEKEILQKNWD